MNLKSSAILKGPEWSSVRALYKGMGFSDYDLSLPMIGIANAWNNANTCHNNLSQVA